MRRFMSLLITELAYQAFKFILFVIPLYAFLEALDANESFGIATVITLCLLVATAE